MAESLQSDCLRIGWLFFENRWIPCKANLAHSKLLSATLHTARYVLNLTTCIGIRIARGVRKLEAISVDDSILFFWQAGKFSEHYFMQQDPGQRIVIEHLTGSDWPNTCIIQFLFATPTDYESARKTNSNMPPRSLSTISPDDASIADSEPTQQGTKRAASDADPSDRPHKSVTVPHDAPLTREEKEAIVAELPSPSEVSDGDSEFSLLELLPDDPDVCCYNYPPDAEHVITGDFENVEIDSDDALGSFVELGICQNS